MKRSMIKCGITALLVIVGMLYIIAAGSDSAEAADTNIRSKGNLILKNGEKIAFYADDIYYLRHEIELLLNEIN